MKDRSSKDGAWFYNAGKHKWPELKNDRDCSHGKLARSCDICDLENHNKELKAENERLRIALMELEALVNGMLAG